VSQRLSVALLVVALLLAIPGLVSAQDVTPVPSGVIDGRFDIGGRSLYLHCEGSGSPTVILAMDGDGPPAMDGFGAVLPQAAEFTRVCTYDRLGTGLSDAPPGPQTARNVVADLRALLAVAGETGPYVLGIVGASTIAGLLHWREFPDEVAGIVLVRPMPSHPGEIEEFVALHFPEDEAFFRGSNREQINWFASIEELAAAAPGRPVPAAVLAVVRAESSVLYENDKIRATFAERRAQELGVGAELVPITDTGHIELERPDAISGAIRGVVEAVRDPSGWQASSATPAAASAVIDGRFDIGGRSLYLRCEGSGSPTVVLEGIPFGTSDWSQVEAGVATLTRVCVYDGAGIGLSDPPPAGIRTLRHFGEDLRALLGAAGVPGPYVMVGAVLGADAVEYYQRSQPADVGGLVLISSRGLNPNGYAGAGELVPEAERAGDDEFHRGANPWNVDFMASADELAAMPIAPIVPAVIIQGDQVEDGMTEDFEAVYRAAREETAHRLGARIVVAPGKGNWIWTEQSQLVAEEIGDVVAAVRDPSTWQSTAATPSA
jgi:hypothetical protein